MKRSAMKRKPTRRSWQAAILKREREGRCRVCGSPYDLESAHIIGRKYDEPDENGVLVVHEDSTVPLCSPHHKAFDARELDLLPYLTIAEQCRAVYEAGGLLSALGRLGGRAA